MIQTKGWVVPHTLKKIKQIKGDSFGHNLLFPWHFFWHYKHHKIVYLLCAKVRKSGISFLNSRKILKNDVKNTIFSWQHLQLKWKMVCSLTLKSLNFPSWNKSSFLGEWVGGDRYFYMQCALYWQTSRCFFSKKYFGLIFAKNATNSKYLKCTDTHQINVF